MKRLLLFAVVLGTMWESIFAYDFKVGNLYYNVISNADLTVEVTSQFENWQDGATYYYYQNGYWYTSNFYSGFYNYYPGRNCYSFSSYSDPIPTTDPSGALEIPSTVTYQNVTFSVIRIGEHAFWGCTRLTSVIIPSSITTIGDSAFYGCSGINTVLIEGDLTSVGGSSFKDCTALTTFTSNGELIAIGNNAFQSCSMLINLNIPSGLENIGTSAFVGCSRLTKIHFDNITVPPSVGANALSDIPLFAFIYVPCFSISTYQQNSSWNQFSHFSGVGAMGNLNVSSQDSSYESVSITDSAGCNSPATIFATANYGYHFSSWNDGNTDNPRVVTVVSDTSFISYYERNRYYVHGESTSNSRGSVQGSDSAYYLDSLTLTAVANYGYVFSHWNDGVTDNPRKVGVTGDMTYYATFEPAPFTITALSSDSTMGYTTGSGMVYYGNSMLIRAYANSNYRFVGWSDGYSSYSRSVCVTSDTTFTALFEPIPQYVLSLGVNNSMMGSVNGGGTFYEGTAVTFSATANTGYRFAGWSDGIVSATRSITMTADTTISANFEYIDYAVRAQSGNTLRGMVEGSDTVHYGETVTLTATAYEHYVFQYWQTAGGEIYGQNPLTITVTSNGVYTAVFVAEQHSVQVLTDGGGTVRIGSSGNSGNYDYFSQLTLTATANGNNAFLRWSDGNTFNPRTVTITSDTVFTALFLNGTTYLHDTIIDTVYFNHYTHDTTFINNYVHDTIYLYQTLYENIHDTLVQYVNQYIHDTIFVNNYVHDTVRITTLMFDTTIVNIYQFDTAIYNTYNYDTIIVNNQYYDTVFVHLHDTIYITEQGIGGVDGLNAKVYSSHGQIVVEGAEGNAVWLYDVTGRVLATKQDNYTPLRFDAPASGTYMIKIGNHAARRVVVVR